MRRRLRGETGRHQAAPGHRHSDTATCAHSDDGGVGLFESDLEGERDRVRLVDGDIIDQVHAGRVPEHDRSLERVSALGGGERHRHLKLSPFGGAQVEPLPIAQPLGGVVGVGDAHRQKRTRGRCRQACRALAALAIGTAL